MKNASITEVKNRLNALISSLKGSSPVVIVDPGLPIARLEGVASGLGSDPDGRLSRLIRDGVVRPAHATPPGALFTGQPPKARASAVEALLDERREER